MFGKRLAYLRGDKTQEEVAKALGLSRARYAHYEQGRSEPSLELLEKMADYFDVSVDYLLGRTNDPEEYVSLDSPEIRAIARKLKNASPQKLDLFHKLVDSMVEEAENDKGNN